jgi:hypothetical protein
MVSVLLTPSSGWEEDLSGVGRSILTNMVSNSEISESGLFSVSVSQRRRFLVQSKKQEAAT